MSSVHIFLLLLSCQNLEGKLVVEEELLYEKFPENFIWGVASSAYQVEGGWNEGKINGTAHRSVVTVVEFLSEVGKIK